MIVCWSPLARVQAGNQFGGGSENLISTAHMIAALARRRERQGSKKTKTVHDARNVRKLRKGRGHHTFDAGCNLNGHFNNPADCLLSAWLDSGIHSSLTCDDHPLGNYHRQRHEYEDIIDCRLPSFLGCCELSVAALVATSEKTGAET